MRALKAEPYTQKEAEAAAGLVTDNGRKPEAMNIDEEVMVDVSAKETSEAVKEIDDTVEYDAFFSVT